MFEKISALRDRLQAIGNPSEHALYARTANSQTQQQSEMPDSARARRQFTGNLQLDSASIIRNNIYSGRRC